MENPPTPSASARFPDEIPHFSPIDNLTDGPAIAASGIWAIDGDHLVCVEPFSDGPAVVLVPCEHVLILTVELPPMASTARRRAALPFAIEDRIGDPLESVHVALGAELSPNIWLAGIVRHDMMLRWAALLTQPGMEAASLVPDALSLPVPGIGGWSVDLAGTRAMVRLADGTASAMPLALLGAAWKAAGEPECVAYGDPLPPGMHGAPATIEPQPLAARLLQPALDLRQGQYAAPRRRVDAIWKRVAMVAALGAAAHGAIALADTLALRQNASAREAEVRALAATLQPGLVIGPDIGSALAEQGADAAPGTPSPFLALLTRSGVALATLQRPVVWRSVQFDRNLGTLTIAVEASDIAELQAATQALTGAGLKAQPGAASTDQGRAVGTIAIGGA